MVQKGAQRVSEIETMPPAAAAAAVGAAMGADIGVPG
eukprot:CAMPEP_0194747092 /NCGR_PEP_ID=MMETSP0323_2-20130528/1153_1 /TAXON_ID=2866 ORGANISM="Crypthecodinium cohnii, Strain Seligo" /NCGR_SAMPLE_ID=MMETSP0323_2 /ASSEMBLY_ACC=CAM_ASM_000346 /LENGTH=36 /DNA_ID= /DNA_START= /DNA_END= /DNA_ORIENTATION=